MSSEQQEPETKHDHGGHSGHSNVEKYLPEGLEVIEADLLDDSGQADKLDTGAMVSNAIGGWRGIIDSGLPSLVFVLVYLLDGHKLNVAIWAAIGAGAAIAAWRLVRRQSVQQVLGGFVMVALSAYVASKTGKAENFFLVGLLLTAAYGLAFLISIFVRWPIVGLMIGGFTGDLKSWRSHPGMLRACTVATWFCFGMYATKLAIQLPMYFAGAVGLLGFTKIALGYPSMIIVGWLSYRVIKPALKDFKAEQAAAAAGGD